MRLSPGSKLFSNELALVSNDDSLPPPRILHGLAVVHPVERFRSEVNGFAIAREVRRWIFNAGKSPLLGPLGVKAKLVLAHPDRAVEIVPNCGTANLILLVLILDGSEENVSAERPIER